MIRKRKLLTAVEHHLNHKQYTIITGARQVGKTSLLQLLFQQLQAGMEKVFFLSLEDHRILQAINEHPERILNFLPEKPKPFLQGKAFEIKWNSAAFKPAKYRKFRENYPNFPLTCLSVKDFYQ